MKKLLFALVAAAALLVGCQPKPVLVSNITLSQTTGSIVEGETLHLSAIVSPKEASNPELTWSSSNTSVATVNGSGDITAVAPGSAKITAAAVDGSGVTASCEITVVKKVIPVSKIDLNETAYTLKKDETLQLTAVITPNDATYQTVTWTSDNPDVASVDATGKVTALKSGTANIVAAATDESGVKSAACAITVVEPKPMYLHHEHWITRAGKSLQQDVWYGSVDTYADREEVTGATWTSANPSVATVDERGNVTGVAEGKTTITVTDALGTSLSFPVTVLPATSNRDYDYNHGIPLLDVKAFATDEAIAADSKAKGLYSQATKFLGDGYVSGTQCYHAKDFTRGYNDDGVTLKNTYLIAQARFDDVDVSGIQNPALFIRIYFSNLSPVHLDGIASEIELSSSFGADAEEIAWKGGHVFTNWPGHEASAKLELKEGWNNIVLPFDITVPNGQLRKNHINWFRMFCNPAAENNMSGKDLEIAIDQLRIIDWTELDNCDNFDMWFDRCHWLNTTNALDYVQEEGVIAADHHLMTGPCSNFRLEMWPGYEFAVPANKTMDDMKLTFKFWTDDAEFFNQWISFRVEICSQFTPEDNGWFPFFDPGKDETRSHFVNGWNTVSFNFSDVNKKGAADERLIKYIRFIFTPMVVNGAYAPVKFVSYKIDDFRIEQK